MKARSCWTVLGLISFSCLFARDGIEPQTSGASASSTYEAEREYQNGTAWRVCQILTNVLGEVTSLTNRYEELESSKRYYANGEWSASREMIAIVGPGAFATNSPHKVFFASNVNSPVSVDVLTPDSKRVKIRVLGLAYYDCLTQTNILLAELKDSGGQVVGNSQVIYTNAFDGLVADLRYTYSKSGLEQDLILRQQLPSPEDYALNRATTRLVLLTEFIDPPNGVQTIERPSSDCPNETFAKIIDFGVMKIGPGIAFNIGGETERNNGIPVEKHWQSLGGRTFLTEEVPFVRLEPRLRGLQAANARYGGSGTRVAWGAGSTNVGLPHHKTAATSKARKMEVAVLDNSEPGVVLDFNLQSCADVVFRSGTTYLITNTVNAGQLSIEGGAVVKFARGAKLNVLGTVTCQTGPYHPALFTAIDDNSVGTVIQGSAGMPSGTYADCALNLGTGGKLEYVNIHYARNAVSVVDDVYEVNNCQILFGDEGFHSVSASFTNRNLLMYQVATNYGGSCFKGLVENATIDRARSLTSDGCFSESANQVSTCGLEVINSIFASIQDGYGPVPVMTNCVRDYPTGGNSPFQSSGAAVHYLLDNSCRNVGTTNIDRELLKDLVWKTTLPPTLYSNATVYSNVTLNANVPRNVGAPDLGYHYDPIDFVVYGFVVSNATMTITNGAVVAFCDYPGITLQGGASIICQGTARQMNRFVNYRTVQELPVRIGEGAGLPVVVDRLGGALALGRFRFCDFSSPADDHCKILCDAVDRQYGALEIVDSSFAGCVFQIACPAGADVKFLNNVFVASPQWISGEGHVREYNNLYYRSSIELSASGTAPREFRNNVFDSASLGDASVTTSVVEDHNAFVNTDPGRSFTNSTDVILTNFAYAKGPLGTFYQMSTNLVDRGSTSAGTLGLSRYTTRLDQRAEGGSLVDIGFHYPVIMDGGGTGLDDAWASAGHNAGGSGQLQLNDSTRSQSESLTDSAPCGGTTLGLLGWWEGEGNGNNVVGPNTLLLDSVTFDSGVVGQAFVFNGYSSSGHLPATAGFDLSQAGGFTIECWMSPVGATPGAPLVAWGTEWNELPVAVWANVWGDNTLSVDIYDEFWSGGTVSSDANALSPGVWQHVAVTYDANSGDVVLYVNGSAVGGGNNGTGLVPSSNWELYVGGFSACDSYYSGMLDEVGLYGRALSAEEIVTIYNAGSAGRCPVAPEFVTQPTSQTVTLGNNAVFSALATGSGLSYQWRSNGIPIEGATEESLRILNVQSSYAASYSLAVWNALGAITSADAVLSTVAPTCLNAPSGLVNWWRAENDALDSLGANNEVLNNGVTFTAGKVGQCFLFNGVNGFGSATHPGLTDITNAYTVEFWASPSAPRTHTVESTFGLGGISGQRYAVFPNHGNNPPYAGMGISVGNNGVSVFEHGDTYLPSLLVYDAAISGWNHIAVVYQNRQPSLYINGVLVRTGLTSTVPSYPSAWLGEMGIGYGYYAGQLDEVSIYSRALSAEEILRIYAAGVAGKCGLSPVITSQPSSQAVLAGATATFNVVATGANPLSYQWTFNGANISGATTSIYTIANVQANKAGNYAVSVFNAFGSVNSSSAALTICIAPSITQQPLDQFAVAGQSASFQVVAAGVPAPTFQWYFNSTPLAGATSSTLNLASVQASDAGSYHVVAANIAGSVFSANALLTVISPVCDDAVPDIVDWWRAEGDATDCAGPNEGVIHGGVTFTAGKVGQCFSFNGANGFVSNAHPGLTEITNAYTVEFWASPSAPRTHTVESTAGLGGVSGQRYAIFPNHGNNPPYAGMGISVGNNGVSVFEHGDTYLPSLLVYDAAISGWNHIAVVYQNRQPSLYVNGVLVRTGLTSTVPSYPSTWLGEIGIGYGYYAGQLDEVSIYSRALSADEIFGIYMAGIAGKCGTPPQITSQPESRSTGLGATVTFNVAANGNGSFTYQWYFGEQALSDAGNVSGSHTATLTLSAVQKSNAGEYYVIVSGCGGAVASSKASLKVGSSAGMWVYTGSLDAERRIPLSALLADGQVLVAGGDSGGNGLSSAELYNPNSGTWTLTGSMNTPRKNSTLTRLSNSLVLVAGGDSGLGTTASAELYNPANGTWTATGSMNSPRTSATAVLLSTGKVLVIGGFDEARNALAATELYDPLVGTWAPIGSLHTPRHGHTAVLLSDGKVLVAGGANQGSQLDSCELYDPLAGAWIVVGSLHAAREGHTAIRLIDGRVLVGGGLNQNGAMSTSELYDPLAQTWTSSGLLQYPRAFHVATLLPSGQVLVAGGTDLAGQGTIYQSAELYDPVTGSWRLTSPMNDARAFTTINLLQNSQVLVAGGNGAGQSAELYKPSASPIPAITIQPQDQTACVGATVTFNSGATGTQPLRYQWSKNGVNLANGGNVSGATTPTLVLTGIAATDTGSYSVNVANDGGAANSAAAVLRISPAPTIAVQPLSQTVQSGFAVPFVVKVGGNETVTYQWYFGNQPLADSPTISGAQTATLIVRNVQQGQVGNYYVVVTGCGGSTTSSTVTLSLADSLPGPWPWPWPWPWPGPGPGPGPAQGLWQFTEYPMTTSRLAPTATLLTSGRVLVVGTGPAVNNLSTEIYNPNNGSWSSAGTLPSFFVDSFGIPEYIESIVYHSATSLPGGDVLIAGGSDGGGGGRPYAAVYDPVSGWAVTTAMFYSRFQHTATLLNGQVLVVGGCDEQFYTVASTEQFDPVAQTWTLRTPLNTPRCSHSATLLSNGKVLVAGGYDWQTIKTAELYNPLNGTWTYTGNTMHDARAGHTACLLSDGRVLVTGGEGSQGVLSTAEIYNPALNTWTYTLNPMREARTGHSAVLLPSGKVLVAGGKNGAGNSLSSAELFDPDPTKETWTQTSSLNNGRYESAIVLLNNGRVLMSGGQNGNGGLSSSELYAVPPPPVPFTIWITEPKANANIP